MPSIDPDSPLDPELLERFRTDPKLFFDVMMRGRFPVGRWNDFQQQFVDDWPDHPRRRRGKSKVTGMPTKPRQSDQDGPAMMIIDDVVDGPVTRWLTSREKVTPPSNSGFLRCENCRDTDWMVVTNPNGVVWGILCSSCNAGFEIKVEAKPLISGGASGQAGLGTKIYTEPKE